MSEGSFTHSTPYCRTVSLQPSNRGDTDKIVPRSVYTKSRGSAVSHSLTCAKILPINCLSKVWRAPNFPNSIWQIKFEWAGIVTSPLCRSPTQPFVTCAVRQPGFVSKPLVCISPTPPLRQDRSSASDPKRRYFSVSHSHKGYEVPLDNH